MIAAHIVERWQQTLSRDRQIDWRSFGFLLAAEAKIAEVEWRFADAEEYKTLLELSFEHADRLQENMIGEE